MYTRGEKSKLKNHKITHTFLNCKKIQRKNYIIKNIFSVTQIKKLDFTFLKIIQPVILYFLNYINKC